MSEPDAYAALHAAIVAGELSPGERLVEEELAERLGHSRGAVRGSLVRLAYEGLVVRSPNRGARVRRYSLEEAVEVLEARAALESLAAGYAALRRTGEEARELEALLEDMRRLHGEGELLEMSERNALLHKRILEISGHEVAGDIAGRLHSQVVRFQFRTVLAAGAAAEVARRARAGSWPPSPPATAPPPSSRCASTSATWRRCWARSPRPPTPRRARRRAGPARPRRRPRAWSSRRRRCAARRRSARGVASMPDMPRHREVHQRDVGLELERGVDAGRAVAGHPTTSMLLDRGE